jgi:hypothetical protein
LEVRQKISNSLKGHIPWNKDKKFPNKKNNGTWEEGHIPWNKGLIGVQKSPKKGIKIGPLKIIKKCPYCGKEGKGWKMHTQHFENCKYKKGELK